MEDVSSEDIGGTYQVSVFSFPQNVDDWDLVRSYLKLRKEVFIDKMSWALYHAEGVEFEQYDTIQSVYIIAHRGRHAIGGARLRRTDWTAGKGTIVYSYMIRDACLGNLPQLPINLCFDTPPVDPSVWELTRLASLGDHSISRAVLEGANAFLKGKAAKFCLFLGPPAFVRMARSLGWEPEPMGPVVGNVDGRFLVFGCKVRT